MVGLDLTSGAAVLAAAAAFADGRGLAVTSAPFAYQPNECIFPGKKPLGKRLL